MAFRKLDLVPFPCLNLGNGLKPENHDEENESAEADVLDNSDSADSSLENIPLLSDPCPINLLQKSVCGISEMVPSPTIDPKEMSSENIQTESSPTPTPQNAPYPITLLGALEMSENLLEPSPADLTLSAFPQSFELAEISPSKLNRSATFTKSIQIAMDINLASTKSHDNEIFCCIDTTQMQKGSTKEEEDIYISFSDSSSSEKDEHLAGMDISPGNLKRSGTFTKIPLLINETLCETTSCGDQHNTDTESCIIQKKESEIGSSDSAFALEHTCTSQFEQPEFQHITSRTALELDIDKDQNISLQVISAPAISYKSHFSGLASDEICLNSILPTEFDVKEQLVHGAHDLMSENEFSDGSSSKASSSSELVSISCDGISTRRITNAKNDVDCEFICALTPAINVANASSTLLCRPTLGEVPVEEPIDTFNVLGHRTIASCTYALDCMAALLGSGDTLCKEDVSPNPRLQDDKSSKDATSADDGSPHSLPETTNSSTAEDHSVGREQDLKSQLQSTEKLGEGISPGTLKRSGTFTKLLNLKDGDIIISESAIVGRTSTTSDVQSSTTT